MNGVLALAVVLATAVTWVIPGLCTGAPHAVLEFLFRHPLMTTTVWSGWVCSIYVTTRRCSLFCRDLTAPRRGFQGE